MPHILAVELLYLIRCDNSINEVLGSFVLIEAVINHPRYASSASKTAMTTMNTP
jgi:hypothetical protein